MENSASPKPAQAALVGLGLDGHDGHRRVTSGEVKGEHFAVLGGSAETHERVTETIIKTYEDLSARGRRLAEAEAREVADLLAKNLPRR